MLRFTHIVSGTILYDGMDITKIPRRTLREMLTIIPQEPVLFNGTVDSNLDPSGKIPKATLERALDECRGIASFQHHAEHDGNSVGPNGHTAENSHTEAGQGIESVAEGISLSTVVSPKGENFSHGQRQVLSLCRALVLMLLDEATASMDYETDRGIQEVLRKELNAQGKDRTLVTIAHRLRTIIDYDTVVVMGGGKVLELVTARLIAPTPRKAKLLIGSSRIGPPHELYRQKGEFYDMVYHSGELEELQKLLRE
jgi:ABC-type multidrug transport system fused ATPase/permease subunit